MPIYVYRCAECGHAGEHIQKLADPVLVECPSCCANRYQKQVTAAGFQLTGTGWYATDFKGSSAKSAASSESSDSAPACPGGGCACH